jgi:hypothetical protein
MKKILLMIIILYVSSCGVFTSYEKDITYRSRKCQFTRADTEEYKYKYTNRNKSNENIFLATVEKVNIGWASNFPPGGYETSTVILQLKKGKHTNSPRLIRLTFAPLHLTDGAFET